jgi:hypothetical protein
MLIVVRAAILALILALPFSGSELVSVGVWLALAVALVGVNLLRYVITVAEVEPAQITVAWTWRFRRRRRPRQVDRRPREVRAIEGIVVSAVDNSRVHAIRLRPRLSELADHFLPIRQGIDPASDPARANALLGDVAWLVDPDMSDRIPTVHELDKFLDIVLAEKNRPARSDQTGND